MYMIGVDHPNKDRAAIILERLVKRGERLVTDAEVFQEILHRYTAIRRPAFIEPAFAILRQLVDEVFPIDVQSVEMARSILAEGAGISARDAIHVATMEVHRVTTIFSFDADYDRTRRVRRIHEA